MADKLREHIRIKKFDAFQERLKKLKPLANTQGAVNATIEAKPEAREVSPNVVELDSENYGAPPENSGIAAYKNGMKSPKASYTEPQAWEDEHGNWFYNFAGAIQLAKALGRTLPNIDQLVAAINANPDNFRQSAGYRRGGDGGFIECGEFSGFWALSDVSEEDSVHIGYLTSRKSTASRLVFGRQYGFPVRFTHG